MSKAIYRIYRPKTFQEVSGQPHVVQTLQNQHASGSIAHAYLFTGPRGVGKTTIARLLAKLVNCEKPKKNEPCNTCTACEQIASGTSLDVHEIDAASHTDVDNVRENIIHAVRFAPNRLKKKVYIIDEVHMLSTSSFNALLKTLEEPPDHAVFILATTEIHKVPETIVSRCQRFDFKRIGAEVLVNRLKGIVKSEGVEVDAEVLHEIVRHAEGCARDAESLLGQVLAIGEKRIGWQEASLVLPMSNAVQVEALIQHLFQQETSKAIALLHETIDQGLDLKHFIHDLIDTLRDKLLASVSSGSGETRLLEYAITELLEAKSRMRLSHIPQLPVELAVVKICRFQRETLDFPQQGVDSGHQETEAPKPLIGPVVLSTPEMPQPVDTIFDTVPVIDIEEVKKKWPAVYEQIKQCNASLPLVMKTCEVYGVDGDHVDLAFDFDLYVQTVNKEKNRTLIENVIEKVVGKRLRVRAVPSKRVESEETIKSLVEEFGGSVV